MVGFGRYVRQRRLALQKTEPSGTLRKIAGEAGLEPSYLSKIERELEAPPSEARIVAIANALGEDPDVLLALAGRVSRDLQDVIVRRPALFAELIRQLKDLPDHALVRLVREVRDGEW